MPKETARNFIMEHEGYDRSFYTGFLGEINLNSGDEKSASTHLFVNLRCMELFEDKAVIFVGGGITSDSIKEKEWEETVAKSATMKAILI
ncbi:MAG: chorismate-binding protein [Flavobacteriaceae bacterium]|nr:chorismate-binding protein [Flavobacteriaceae bacterium]